MKRKIFSLIVVLVVTISFINVWISVGSTNAKVKLRLAAIDAMAMIEAETPGDTELSLSGSCKITFTCYDSWTGAWMVVLLAGELNIANEELKRKV